MRTKQKQSSILSILVSLTLIFLCVFGVTYSYFTASKTVSGTAQFSTLEVKIGYKTSQSSSLTTINTPTFTVYPSESTIVRGGTFGFKVNSTDAQTLFSLNFTSSSTSCSAYIRYWVDAYVVNGSTPDKSVNYGRYFQLNSSMDVAEVKTVTNPTTGVVNVMYYYAEALPGGETSLFANGMTLLSSAPDDIMQKKLQITISFDAVQSTNQAFASYYTDGWGYCSWWK